MTVHLADAIDDVLRVALDGRGVGSPHPRPAML
jgi:hypothetical protein